MLRLDAGRPSPDDGGMAGERTRAVLRLPHLGSALDVLDRATQVLGSEPAGGAA